MFDKYETRVVNNETEYVIKNETTNVVINPITVDVGIAKRVLTFDMDSVLADQILRPNPADPVCTSSYIEVILKESSKEERSYNNIGYDTTIDVLSVVIPIQIHQITFLGKTVCITYNYDIKHIIPLSYSKVRYGNSSNYYIYGREKGRFISNDEKYLIINNLTRLLKDFELSENNSLVLEEV